MPKLTALKPVLKPLSHRVSKLGAYENEQQRFRQRDESQAYRKWYKTARWQKLRMSVLVRDLFTCQMVGCGRIMADTSKLVCDHRTPHRGREVLFWDERNLQCICKECHDSIKQQEEQATLHLRGNWD
ncbi:HNH endonuclease [Phyllobacterium sp. YR620]|uniref:HNH endonuclease n=1 Tax=Phyllobacterium sp. YR620 TaxID=1881066 RepID=UPI0008860349|nr:HNH endonuclease signature motif containing protein [Phyllobacterium sp. YR620]SDP92421.1 HNH endonuclease [Phyllobacterium sp. YR620]